MPGQLLYAAVPGFFHARGSGSDSGNVPAAACCPPFAMMRVEGGKRLPKGGRKLLRHITCVRTFTMHSKTPGPAALAALGPEGERKGIRHA